MGRKVDSPAISAYNVDRRDVWRLNLLAKPTCETRHVASAAARNPGPAAGPTLGR
jgi:hypothetical protein